MALFMGFTSLLLIVFLWQPSEAATPIVLWHGMGDGCCMPYSLGPFMKFLQREIPDVYIKSLRIGGSVTEDLENGYFMSPNKQIDMACNILAADKNLTDGFHAIGFSQGGQFLRAVVQRCGNSIPPMRNLISLGGQHQGVYGLPNCAALKHKSCNYVRRLLNHAAYLQWVQEMLVQATYWHDPLNEDLYRQNSLFLADINNENSINETYVNNLKTLEKFVMVKFEKDTMVQPIETEWFGFYKPGQAVEVQSLNETDLFTSDRLGLQDLYARGVLQFLSAPGNHLQFTDEWFIDNIIKNYLN